jgi:hypothetical protein
MALTPASLVEGAVQAVVQFLASIHHKQRTIRKHPESGN